MTNHEAARVVIQNDKKKSSTRERAIYFYFTKLYGLKKKQFVPMGISENWMSLTQCKYKLEKLDKDTDL